ncbi:MAG: N-6 DNA methylase [Clostridia bacterium]|nr:N-6 DNA methylase [Clostridia bacterium]
MSKKFFASQLSLFDIFLQDNALMGNNTETEEFVFTDEDKLRLDDYTLDNYCDDVNTYGLSMTWDKINYFILNYDCNNSFLDISDFGELYETGLALANKQQKKDSGQYYTPDDVAYVMSSWFNELTAENICDVACGTGKLILTYLDILGEEKARKLISEGRLYLYDIDKTAINICKTILLKKYGKELETQIHDIHCDFLDSKISLPDNCKVISNPPYTTVKNLLPQWDNTDVASDTKELYSMFMEKIITQSISSVIITPYSFIGGNKFYSLRQLLNNYSGFIVSFDNVPGNIFRGRKHGIFNTNTSNSVRAAITVVKNDGSEKGFRLTPLLRFRTDERTALLKCKTLESFISDKLQIVDNKNPAYSKCHKELQNLYDCWLKASDNKIVKDILSSEKTDYILYVPNTCRYFTTASVRRLNRTGVMTLFAKDKATFEFLYCLINSSFAYWWWRIFDGGITYQIGLLNKMPVFFDALSDDDKKFFSDTFAEMIAIEEECIVTKLNAGTEQENIKFPCHYREILNQRFLKILSCNQDYKLLDLLHQNNVFGEKKID